MTLLMRLTHYSQLIRLHKPIPLFLLLWPTLWALWLASGGWPTGAMLFIFVAGVFLMRSAGCIVNDIADRNFDGKVMRTQNRPLAARKLSVKEALGLAMGLSLIAFGLVLFCNALTIELAFVGLGLAVGYPLLKRITHLPQLGLGVAFAWGIPMAFAAQTSVVTSNAWFLFATAVIWPVIYDTMYAMVDRPDDVKIGVKSTAILFGQYDRLIIGLLQLLFVGMLIGVGFLFQLHTIFYGSLFCVLMLFAYQQWLIKDRLPHCCLQAFLNNQWVGFIIFIGILLSDAG